MGGAAVASLVLGCTWTLYANVFRADVYPTLGSANYDAPIVRWSTSVAEYKAQPTAHTVVAVVREPAPELIPSSPSLLLQKVAG